MLGLLIALIAFQTIDHLIYSSAFITEVNVLNSLETLKLSNLELQRDSTRRAFRLRMRDSYTNPYESKRNE